VGSLIVHHRLEQFSMCLSHSELFLQSQWQSPLYSMRLILTLAMFRLRSEGKRVLEVALATAGTKRELIDLSHPFTIPSIRVSRLRHAAATSLILPPGSLCGTIRARHTVILGSECHSGRVIGRLYSSRREDQVFKAKQYRTVPMLDTRSDLNMEGLSRSLFLLLRAGCIPVRRVFCCKSTVSPVDPLQSTT
jgi:hypothetical protein